MRHIALQPKARMHTSCKDCKDGSCTRERNDVTLGCMTASKAPGRGYCILQLARPAVVSSSLTHQIALPCIHEHTLRLVLQEAENLTSGERVLACPTHDSSFEHVGYKLKNQSLSVLCTSGVEHGFVTSDPNWLNSNVCRLSNRRSELLLLARAE